MKRLFLLGIILTFLSCRAFANAAVLTQKDVSLYEEIFALQNQGKIKEAILKEKQLQNPLLKGYVLYNRYFSPKYKTTKSEIKEWMESYSDYPIAPEIYALGIQNNDFSSSPEGVIRRQYKSM